MGQNTNRRKAEQLGMPFGTASARLRKQIMFRMLEQLGENICFKCSMPMTVDTFTIEHKEPWLDCDIALFWNMENVAFSHAKCNIPNRYVNNWPRRAGVDGNNTKLSLEEVEQIRASTESDRVVGKQYGISHRQVQRIRKREQWVY